MGKPSVGSIEDAEAKVESVRSSYLRARGWTSTCDTPGSYWMWMKDFNGKTYVVESKFAVSIERANHFLTGGR